MAKKPEKNPYDRIPFNPVAFLLSTAKMDLAPLGAYTRILFKGWLDTHPVGIFPDDDIALAELADVSSETWSTIKTDVRKRFRPGPQPGTLVQQRLFETWRELHHHIKKQKLQARAAGKQSAKVRLKNARKNKRRNKRSTPVQRPSTNRRELNGIELKRTNPQQRALRDALVWMGVGAVDECAERGKDGLTAAEVLLMRREANGAADKCAAVVSRIRKFNSPTKLVPAEAIAEWAFDGIIASVCDHAIAGKTGVSTNGVLVLRADQAEPIRIPADKLTPDQIGWNFTEEK